MKFEVHFVGYLYIMEQLNIIDSLCVVNSLTRIMGYLGNLEAVRSLVCRKDVSRFWCLDTQVSYRY
jgi:hypothetical protein